MQFIEMTIEEALEYSKGDKSKIVLVAVQNLELNETPVFMKKDKRECENIIRRAETVARVCDDFVNQLRIFSKKQADIMNIEPHGKLSTILLRGGKEEEKYLL